jgi:hypothetical protein
VIGHAARGPQVGFEAVSGPQRLPAECRTSKERLQAAEMRLARRESFNGAVSFCSVALHLSSTGKWTWYASAEMALTRTFVSFSSTDIGRYRLMCAWKAHEHIDFDFADFQLDEAINSKNPSYIKSVCRAKIRRADTFVLLIGADTWQKTVFVKAEVEVATEKECRLIGVNLNNFGSRTPCVQSSLRTRERYSYHSHHGLSQEPLRGSARSRRIGISRTMSTRTSDTT